MVYWIVDATIISIDASYYKRCLMLQDMHSNTSDASYYKICIRPQGMPPFTRDAYSYKIYPLIQYVPPTTRDDYDDKPITLNYNATAQTSVPSHVNVFIYVPSPLSLPLVKMPSAWFTPATFMRDTTCIRLRGSHPTIIRACDWKTSMRVPKLHENRSPSLQNTSPRPKHM
jgi:hypothetical protein